MMQTKKEKNGRIIVVVAVGVIVIGLACMVAGVVLMVKYSNSQITDNSTTSDPYTKEAKDSGLDVLLKKLQDTYFDLNPDRIGQKPGVSDQEIRLKYRPRDLSPARLKYVADQAKKLLAEFQILRTIRSKLSIREKRALELAKFWVKHVFPYGVPYGYDYYVADWLLGPDVFCWMPVCYVGESFQATILRIKPSSVEDMELVRERLKDVNRTFAQYVENMKMGIEIGMVRNIEGCKAGLDGIKHKFLQISLHGEQGVFNSSFLPANFFTEFLSVVENKPDVLESWQKKYGKTMNDSLKEDLVKYIGKPVTEMLRYLEFEYSQYCPSGDVLTGYNSLPLTYVYKNGSKIRRTTKRLPSGELIDGKESYRIILDYFITSNISSQKINQIGHSMLKEIYPKILEIAREVSGESDNKTAEEYFKNRTRADDMYFNEEEIPASESDTRAYTLCSTDEGAKKYCPVRWKAIQNWFTYSRQVMAALDAKTINLFHFAGKMHTTPNCPVKLSADYNPSNAAQGYTPSDNVCSRAAEYAIPFFLKKPGPKYEEWTVCAHETRPGHHLQAQGFSERFSRADDGVIKWLSSSVEYFLGFQEGWALYAEDPLIAKDTDAYNGFPLRKYGTLKWEIFQAVRLIADSGFHYIGNFSREDALELIERYAWDKGDIPQKEITRYQSLPGQATAYVVGKLYIMKLRKLAEERLGDEFNLKDFHFQLLQHGPSPFSFLEEMINLYIECVLDGTKVTKREGCEEILNPPKLGKNRHSSGNKIEDTMVRFNRFRLR